MFDDKEEEDDDDVDDEDELFFRGHPVKAVGDRTELKVLWFQTF